jgi:Xaa-Pro aminopeptidase
MNQRMQRLIETLDQHELDGLLIASPENRRYLSGFSGSAGVLIITPQVARLATDFRYYEQVREQAPDFELVEAPQRMEQVLAREIADLGLKRVGFESAALTYETYESWRKAMPASELVPTTGLVEGLRAIKDEGELAAIIEAVRVADEAIEHLMDTIRPGMTERQVAWELEVHMRTHGAEALAFTTIVAAGPHGAMSHAVVTDRPIRRGEPVVIDMGARVDGYCSDITRSFCIGEADERYLSVWHTVLEAQQAAERQIRAGMTGIQADAIARDLIYGAGYEGQFGHGLGHGVGLAIHEEPRASMVYPGELPAGMVLTVEPGIYIPGWGGIRIEDMVVVGATGCRILTRARKEPVVAGR